MVGHGQKPWPLARDTKACSRSLNPNRVGFEPDTVRVYRDGFSNQKGFEPSSLLGVQLHRSTDEAVPPTRTAMPSPSVVLTTSGYDHTIRFWEATSGICYRTLQYTESVRVRGRGGHEMLGPREVEKLTRNGCRPSNSK